MALAISHQPRRLYCYGHRQTQGSTSKMAHSRKNAFSAGCAGRKLRRDIRDEFLPSQNAAQKILCRLSCGLNHPDSYRYRDLFVNTGINKKAAGRKRGPPKTGLWDKDMSPARNHTCHWISCNERITFLLRLVNSKRTLLLSNLNILFFIFNRL